MDEEDKAEIRKELEDVIKGQLLKNYMSLSTYRIGFPYKKGYACDKCYVEQVIPSKKWKSSKGYRYED